MTGEGLGSLRAGAQGLRLREAGGEVHPRTGRAAQGTPESMAGSWERAGKVTELRDTLVNGPGNGPSAWIVTKQEVTP